MRYAVHFIVALCCLGLWSVAGPAYACERGFLAHFSTDLLADSIIRGCSEVIRRDKKAAWAYRHRGAQQSNKGEYDRAIADYSKAIQLDPKPDDYSSRASAYRWKGEFDRAIADFSEAIRLEPTAGTGYAAMGYKVRAWAYWAKGDYERATADFYQDVALASERIRLSPKDTSGYISRSAAYAEMGHYDRAIEDYSEAIRLEPNKADHYVKRGRLYLESGDQDRAVTDFTEAIQLHLLDRSSGSHSKSGAYSYRGDAFAAKRDYERAIADYSEAIRIAPTYDPAISARGDAYAAKGDHDRAKADYSRVIAIVTDDIKKDGAFARPRYSHRAQLYEKLGDYDRAIADYNAHGARIGNADRGNAYRKKGDYGRALIDLNEAIRLDASNIFAYLTRCETHEAKGERSKAIDDCTKALAIPPLNKSDRERQAEAMKRLAVLQPVPSVTKPVVSPPALALPKGPASPGRRVALVIGNATYSAIERLANPANDARAVAASLRRLGFAEVIERYDLSLAAMVDALKAFGDKSADADWSIVYYAGHGIEVGGTTYLIPTDARLLRDTHVADEALPLDRVLAKVEAARKLRLIILDACRTNPFAVRMARAAGSGRSVGRGLARIEPDGGVIVAYAAKHGTIAQDGPAAHSPFTEALLHHLEEPSLEIQFLFRKVRDRVLDRTGKAQEPFVYGSLGSEPLYFKVGGAQ